MLFVSNYALAVFFCVITMLCWGSWGNTQKLAGKTWRYELFYWDYVIGVLLFSIISGFTAGSMGGAAEWGFVANLKQAAPANIGWALLGGVVPDLQELLLADSPPETPNSPMLTGMYMPLTLSGYSFLIVAT